MSEQVSHDSSDFVANLDYARALHDAITAINKDLYSRAQIALTTNSLAIATLSAVLASSPDNVSSIARRAGLATGVFAMLASIGIVGAVTSAFMALYSRHLSGKTIGTGSSDMNDLHLWFYGRIAEIAPSDFIAAARLVDSRHEAQIRLLQVATMAPLMTQRAKWVNLAYLASWAGFVFLVAASVSYVLALM